MLVTLVLNSMYGFNMTHLHLSELIQDVEELGEIHHGLVRKKVQDQKPNTLELEYCCTIYNLGTSDKLSQLL